MRRSRENWLGLNGGARPLLIAVAGICVILLVTGIGVAVAKRRLMSPTPAAAVVVAAGDIACDPLYPTFNNGNGTATQCHEKATARLVEQIKPRRVLTLGDIQYVRGTPQKYSLSYDPTWGKFKDLTSPTIGNHEGGEGGTNKVYFDYFSTRAGDPALGYYSFQLGNWHIVSLNSNCGFYSFNKLHTGCERGSAQDQWLRADLADHPVACTLAYFHVPRFSSGAVHHSDAKNPTLAMLWQDLYRAGVDLVLNGHSHNYERFAPMTPNGAVDPARGIREFVVGTGGDNLHSFVSTPVPGSEVRSNDSFGVLRLTLGKDSYQWRFVNDGSPGTSNNDSGRAACHR